MQKLVTVTVDIAALQSQSEGSFSVREIDAVGELLAEGWNIESWEFITGDQEVSKAVILMLLNDGMDGIGYEESFYEMNETGFGDEDEEAETDESEAGSGGGGDAAEADSRQ